MHTFLHFLILTLNLLLPITSSTTLIISNYFSQWSLSRVAIVVGALEASTSVLSLIVVYWGIARESSKGYRAVLLVLTAFRIGLISCVVSEHRTTGKGSILVTFAVAFYGVVSGVVGCEIAAGGEMLLGQLARLDKWLRKAELNAPIATELAVDFAEAAVGGAGQAIGLAASGDTGSGEGVGRGGQRAPFPIGLRITRLVPKGSEEHLSCGSDATLYPPPPYNV